MTPLAIDLFCGLGGWTDGLLAEGYYVVGFDVERHDYGDGKRYPAQLVLQDVLTLHGRQFKDATLIVASPPCQEYSYMAMPWSLAKAVAAEYRNGVRDVKKLTALFDACFRIQREASEAAGRHIPLIVENVRGACPWVGRSRWNFGAYHLWGDVPALMPITNKRAVMKAGIAHRNNGETNFHGYKNPGFRFDGSGRSFQTESVESTGVKGGGGSWFGNYAEGIKQGGVWFNASQPSISRMCSSKSKARKAASAVIAKIPLPLSRYIASVFRPGVGL
jgi:hypothetical protein